MIKYHILVTGRICRYNTYDLRIYDSKCDCSFLFQRFPRVSKFFHSDLMMETIDIQENIIKFLSEVPLFGSFNACELSIVAKYMNIIGVGEGECLFNEGDPGDCVCFVLEGNLDVLKKTENEENIKIASLSKGHSIGEMSILDHIFRSATIKAREKSALVSLSQKDFDSILDDNPKIGIKILKGLSRHLSLNMRKTSKLYAETSESYMSLMENYRNTF